MFLQRLGEYATRLDRPPQYYRRVPVRYIIELDAGGTPLSAEPVDTADSANRATRRGQPLLMPQVQRANAVRPLLFADNGAYTLGLPREGANPDREAQCHEAYLDLLRGCAAHTAEPDVMAVLCFLENDPLNHLRLPDDFDRSATVSFRVDGRLPADLPAVREYWARVNDPGADDGATVMDCLVCGERGPVLRRLKGKIKGIPGGQMSGTAIISANESAYESYGLDASLISPICARCAEDMTVALNGLLADESSRLIVGNAAFVFWTREPQEWSFADLMSRPETDDVRRILASLYRPAGGHVDDNRFYAALLSASGGRAVVRDWIDTSLPQAQRNLARWFAGQRIVSAWGEEARPLGLYALAAAGERELRDVPPPTLRALVRCALLGQPLPPGVLYRAVQRTRADQGVSRPQAALMKLALVSRRWTAGHSSPDQEDTMTQLDNTNRTPPYLCGRLLAVLERAQALAIPGANATLVDRFYGTASTAPATVFGSLMQNAQAHLGKLRRDRPGSYHRLQGELEDILADLPAFPRTLSLDEQALFALGYYHQRAHSRAMARAAREAAAGPGKAEVEEEPDL
ncbi:MAG: type I-C CRISPR-associated protein Cas8c/Csd1 [Anaerolineae bacterium]|jgi:CRISPR-associated protein Csd1